MHTVNIRLKQTGFDNFSGRQCCHLSRKVVLSPQSLWPLLASKIVNYFFDHNHTCGFQHYMFNMESRNLLNFSVQNALIASQRTSISKFSWRRMRPKLPSKMRRSQSLRSLSRPYCHCILHTMSLGPLHHRILRPPLPLYINAPF